MSMPVRRDESGPGELDSKEERTGKQVSVGEKVM